MEPGERFARVSPSAANRHSQQGRVHSGMRGDCCPSRESYIPASSIKISSLGGKEPEKGGVDSREVSSLLFWPELDPDFKHLKFKPSCCVSPPDRPSPQSQEAAACQACPHRGQEPTSASLPPPATEPVYLPFQIKIRLTLSFLIINLNNVFLLSLIFSRVKNPFLALTSV